MEDSTTVVLPVGAGNPLHSNAKPPAWAVLCIALGGAIAAFSVGCIVAVWTGGALL